MLSYYAMLVLSMKLTTNPARVHKRIVSYLMKLFMINFIIKNRFQFITCIYHEQLRLEREYSQSIGKAHNLTS